MAKAPTPTDAISVKTDKPISAIATVVKIRQKTRLKENAILITEVATEVAKRTEFLGFRYLSSASNIKNRAITT